jgi:protein-S-isoprenylcysteine O-methyltransferase Ste14
MKIIMENEFTFRIILLILVFAFIAHRGYYTRKNAASDENTLKKREEGLASRLAAIFGLVGFIAMILYVVNPNWISIASISFPVWVRWTGVGIALMGFILLQWAQSTLGSNWSDTPRMMEEQRLVTSGPYQWIRHPIYTAFLLILGSTLFISANWLIGLAWAGMTVLEILSRIRFEESIMLEYFGDEYREYMKKAGALMPKLNF